MPSISIVVFGRKYFHHLTTVSEPLNNKKDNYAELNYKPGFRGTKSDIV